MKIKSLLSLTIAALSISLINIASASTDAQTAPVDQTYIAGTAGTGVNDEPATADPFIARRLGQEPIQVAAGPNEPIQLAAAPAGAKPAAKPAAGPSLSQKIGWGLAIATAVNLVTGNVVGIAWAWHAALTVGGGYVGATTVADKMK